MEWNSPENLETHFEVAKGVLLDAGLVVCNPGYDSAVSYSKELLITRLERICSYDETKVELDCTKSGAGSRVRCIRDGSENDGEAVVTKLDRCT